MHAPDRGPGEQEQRAMARYIVQTRFCGGGLVGSSGTVGTLAAAKQIRRWAVEAFILGGYKANPHDIATLPVYILDSNELPVRQVVITRI
jgi:hypothetical protein